MKIRVIERNYELQEENKDFQRLEVIIPSDFFVGEEGNLLNSILGRLTIQNFILKFWLGKLLSIVRYYL